MINLSQDDERIRVPGSHSTTQQLAEFAATMAHIELPEDVVTKVMWHLIDTLGCAAAGAELPIAAISRAAAKAIGANGHCRVFGTEQLYSPAGAAFANASIANALDFDDGTEVNGKGLGHPGATLIPAALAGLDRFEVSGDTLIRALTAGYEVNNRLIVSLQPSPERFEQVYGVSQHQSIGAAVVYGVLAGLDVKQLHNAIGLAATLTNVPSLHKYNWQDRPIVSLKDGVAPAAMAGVLAVEYTLAGLMGSVEVLDGPTGFWRMMGSDQFDFDTLVSDLGREWRTLESSFKLYPACRWLAPALEAFESLRDLNRLDPERIAGIQVHTFSKIANDLSESRPTNEIDAQFSLPYLIAALALRLPPGPEWFKSASLHDAQLLTIAQKVKIHVDPAMDAAMKGSFRRPSATVTVDMADGTHHKLHVPAPQGGRLRPVSYDAVCSKALSNFNVAGISGSKVIAFAKGLYGNPGVVSFERLLQGMNPV